MRLLRTYVDFFVAADGQYRCRLGGDFCQDILPIAKEMGKAFQNEFGVSANAAVEVS